MAIHANWSTSQYTPTLKKVALDIDSKIRRFALVLFCLQIIVYQTSFDIRFFSQISISIPE